MLDPSTLVSVIISNYNYAQFVEEAIESALALDWPRVEVIVVDDGSTDDSRSVIQQYAQRVTVVTQVNSGQAVACRVGFERSRGEVVIFLDADDLLDPRIIRTMAPLWDVSVSKVQFQMKTIDAAGRDLGSVFPPYSRVPSPAQLRQWALQADTYPTPPGSGNAYSRKFVERVILDVDAVDKAADSALLAAAPFLGDVVTIPQPLVSYRIHGSNDGAMLKLDISRFAREWLRARRRFAYALSVARSVGLDAKDDAFNRSLTKLCYRAASWRLARNQHPICEESAWGIVVDALAAARVDDGQRRVARMALAVWIVLVCVVPGRVAARMVNWRFIPSTRPKPIRRLLNAFGIARTTTVSSFGGKCMSSVRS